MAEKRRQERVHVLMIEHRHGSDVYVCRTEAIAHNHLDRYVREWWEYEMEGQPMPKDADQRWQQYFAEMSEKRGEEFYTLWETQILEK